MGNVNLSASVRSCQVFVSLLYRVLWEKLHVYWFGRLSNIEGPIGLSLNEIHDFETQFSSFATPWSRRYGHRLDAEVHPRLKLTIVGGEPQEVDPDSLVAPRQKPEADPIIVPLDQLHFNSNTVNAVALLVQYFMGTGYLPSRTFLYYLARTNMDNNISALDDGVSFADVFAVLNLSEPVPDEAVWPYSNELLNRKPHCSLAEAPYIPYVGVQLNPALSNLKACLALNGPFVAAITATKEFELHARYRYDPSDMVEGFQALMFIKFSEETQSFTAVNSFGSAWGDRGTVQLHVSDLYKDPVFTNAIYTFVPDLGSSDDEEKSD